MREGGRRKGKGGERGRERERQGEQGERESCNVFNTWTLPIHPPIPGFFLMSLVFFVCFVFVVLLGYVLRFEPRVGG